jgi:hypothetical protein
MPWGPEGLWGCRVARKRQRRVVGVPFSSATACHRSGRLPRLRPVQNPPDRGQGVCPVPEDGTVALVGQPSSPLGLPRKTCRCAVCPEGRSAAGSDPTEAVSAREMSVVRVPPKWPAAVNT